MATSQNKRNATVAAAAAAGVVGLGYSALRGLAWLDRRRHHIDGDLEAMARDALAFPDNAEHETIKTRDGGRMHVVSVGPINAQPIVLLHGVTLQAAVWSGQLRDLGTTYRVIAPDFRGHGKSTPGRDGYGVEYLARDLLTLLEHFSVRESLIVGHSMGGMALMRAAVDFPELLRTHICGLVFLSTAASRVATGPLTAPLRIGRAIAQRQPETVGRAATQTPRDIGYAAVRFGFGPKPSPLWVEQLRQLLSEMSPLALSASTLALLDHDVKESLHNITTPTRVIVGTHDLVTPLKQSEEIANEIPNAELIRFDGVGHTIMLERRAELSQQLDAFASACLRASHAQRLSK
jgi:non-heme chloroperoxidase